MRGNRATSRILNQCLTLIQNSGSSSISPHITSLCLIIVKKSGKIKFPETENILTGV